MVGLEIVQVPVLSDNYVYLVHASESGATAVVDPAVSEPIIAELARRGWQLTHILNTHHHGDHTGGNRKLKAAFDLTVVGADNDAARIPGIDVRVRDGQRYDFGGHQAQVFEVPGHTSGHIAYYFADSDALFCGDTLFALGCGRVFEGTMTEMWTSLDTLRGLPDATRVYCAHEYTQANAKFALSVDGTNLKLRRRAAEIDDLRARGIPTVPSLLGTEKSTNPFLRADDPAFAAALGMAAADPVAVFAEVRSRKDNF